MHEKEDSEQGGDGKGGNPDDTRAALDQAKKELKHLHKMNKGGAGFIASKATTTMQSSSHEGSHSGAHEGVQRDSPMLEGEPRPLEELTEKALGHTENSEPVGL